MNNNQDKEKLIKEWIVRAEDDELNINAILKDREGTPAHVCFTCQQMSEKYLKALLLFYSGDYPKIHSLASLIILIQSYENSISETLKNEAIVLDPYYIEARYPADVSLENFTWEMAEQAFEAAVKIKNFVLDKIKTE